MNITVWYLSSCSTCIRIITELNLDQEKAHLINIKTVPVSEAHLEAMKGAVGSYKALINGRSTQFRAMDKKAKDLSEEEARKLLLQHYSFLKRPVIKIDEDYFIGNSKKVVESVKSRIRHG